MDLNDALKELQDAKETLVERLKELLTNTQVLGQKLSESEAEKRKYKVTLELLLSKLEAIDYQNEEVDAHRLAEGIVTSIRTVLGEPTTIVQFEKTDDAEGESNHEDPPKGDIPDSLPPWFDKYL